MCCFTEVCFFDDEVGKEADKLNKELEKERVKLYQIFTELREISLKDINN